MVLEKAHEIISKWGEKKIIQYVDIVIQPYKLVRILCCDRNWPHKFAIESFFDDKMRGKNIKLFKFKANAIIDTLENGKEDAHGKRDSIFREQ